MTGGECPRDALQGQAILNVAVFGYISIIVEKNEIAMRDLPECQEAGNRQENINNEDLLLWVHAYFRPQATGLFLDFANNSVRLCPPMQLLLSNPHMPVSCFQGCHMKLPGYGRQMTIED